MIRLLLSFSISICFISFSQDDQLIDYPIKHLKDNCFNYYVNFGVDSVREIYTRVEILTVDFEDNCVPAEYEVSMTQHVPIKYHLLATIGRGDTSFHTLSYTVPPLCQYWTKPDSNTLYFRADLSVDNKQNKGNSGAYKPDSVLQTDMSCVAQFYSFENDSVRSDTLFERKGTAFDLNSHNGIPYWQCSYFYELKHGKELAYYHVNEISGKCVNANTNLKKYEGQWKYGKQKGKWYFYTPMGDLERIEYYRKGVCKKIKRIENGI